MNLVANLAAAAQRDPTRAAVRLDEQVWTYGALDEASARAGSLLHALGVAAGDRVAIMLPKVPEFAIAYYGTLRAGAIVVPINPGLKERELAHYLEDSGPACGSPGRSMPLPRKPRPPVSV